MIWAELTPALAAALPSEVREALGAAPGDPIGFELDEGTVRISRATADLSDDDVRRAIATALTDPRPPIAADQAFTTVLGSIARRGHDA